MCMLRMWHKHFSWQFNTVGVAIGQSFHVVAGSALTLRWYAEQMADWFHQPARLSFLPWEEWKLGVSS